MARAQTESDPTGCINWHINQHSDVVKTLTFRSRDDCTNVETPRDWTGFTAVLVVKDPETNTAIFDLRSTAGEITLSATGEIVSTFPNAKTELFDKQQKGQALHALEETEFPGYEWELWVISAAGLREMVMQGLILSDTNIGPV